MWTSQVLMPPKPPNVGGNTPKPFNRRENAHITFWYPWNILMHREPTTECGGVNEGEVPPNMGGVREVS